MPKKRNKQYRPRPVRTAPIIYDAYGDMTTADITRLYEFAAHSLDLCQLGTTDRNPYSNVRAAITQCFVLSAAYENKADLQALCCLADAGVLIAWEAANDEERRKKKDQAYLAQCRRLELAPAQRVLEVLAQMHKTSPRSELVRAFRAGAGRPVVKLIEAAGIVRDNGEPPGPNDQHFVGERGLAWIHGECRAGYLHWDGKRLVWKMPQTDSQVWLSDPTFILVVPSGTNYQGELK